MSNVIAGVLFYCIAPTRRHEQCAELILDREADVNNCSHSGTPVLLHACETALGNEQICLRLLRKGADPNSKDQVYIAINFQPKLCVTRSIYLDYLNDKKSYLYVQLYEGFDAILHHIPGTKLIFIFYSSSNCMTNTK